MGRRVEVPAHRFLYRAGDPVRVAYFLAHGTVKRAVDLPGATPKVIELAQPQQLLALGETFAVPHHASSAETITPCIFVALEMRRLRALVRRSPGLAWRLLEAVAQRQCATECDVTGHHYSVTGPQRLLDYLIELSGGPPALAGETTVVLKASKKVIASRVGMTPETLSRSLRHLTDSGLIVVDGRNVHIQNAALVDGVAEGTPRVSFPRKPRARDTKPTTGAVVNLCGRPRMLSQRLAIAWAMIARGIAPSAARVKLRQFETELSRHLARLATAGLRAELGAHLAALTDLWARYRLLLSETVPAAAPRAHEVLAVSEDMLQAADRLAGTAARLAATPEAHYVNIAGRNRMLSQRIVKLFLFREWLGDDGTRRDVDASRKEFRRNLGELRRGTQRPEVTAQLDEVAEQWQQLVAALAADSHAGREHHAQAVLAAGERLLRHVDTAVKLYERLAPQPA